MVCYSNYADVLAVCYSNYADVLAAAAGPYSLTETGGTAELAADTAAPHAGASMLTPLWT